MSNVIPSPVRHPVLCPATSDGPCNHHRAAVHFCLWPPQCVGGKPGRVRHQCECGESWYDAEIEVAS